MTTSNRYLSTDVPTDVPTTDVDVHREGASDACPRSVSWPGFLCPVLPECSQSRIVADESKQAIERVHVHGPSSTVRRPGCQPNGGKVSWLWRYRRVTLFLPVARPVLATVCELETRQTSVSTIYLQETRQTSVSTIYLIYLNKCDYNLLMISALVDSGINPWTHLDVPTRFRSDEFTDTDALCYSACS